MMIPRPLCVSRESFLRPELPPSQYLRAEGHAGLTGRPVGGLSELTRRDYAVGPICGFATVGASERGMVVHRTWLPSGWEPYGII
jgi:hypothetical protein